MSRAVTSRLAAGKGATGASPLEGDAADHAEWMGTVPAGVRARIVSSMRWTIWLTALAAPHSYGTSILLARTSPETIGTYGLLAVYVALVSSVFYLGGDAVPIKFLPELAAPQRARFLATYFVLICASMAAWLLLAATWHGALRALFGGQADIQFLLAVLGLAPIPIFFFLISASLKARLDFRHSQMLTRLITIGSFLFYVTVFTCRRDWLKRHPAPILWSVYLSLTAVAAACGAWRLMGKRPWRYWRRIPPRLFLPRGFWNYTLGTQQVSMARFLQRFDYVLVLNFGGLKVLGEYVAVTTLALAIPLVCGFFYDTLLPSLTNLLATGNCRGAAEVFRVHMRILFLVSAAGAAGLMLFAAPLTGLLGAQYVGLAPAVAGLSLLVGTASPGAAGSTLLSSIGKPQRAASVTVLHLGLYAGAFFLLWPQYRLPGAILGLGLSTLIANALLFIVGTRSVPFPARMGRDYARFGAVMALTGLCAWRWTLQDARLALPLWAASMLAYLGVGGYRLDECRAIWHCFVPVRCRPGNGAIRSRNTADTDCRPAPMPVSVIIPTKGRPSELRSTVESLFRQSCPPAELIIIDQNLNEDSRRAVESARWAVPRPAGGHVRTIHIQDLAVRGAAAARNRGLGVASGEILLFLDDDVTLEQDFIEQLLHVYGGRPDVAGASGIITNYRRPGPLVRAWNTVFARGPFRDERQPIYWRAHDLRHSPPLPVTKFTGACMSFRAGAIARLRFDERIPQAYGEDLDFSLRVRRAGALVIAPRARLAHHRSSAGRTSEHYLKREARAAGYLYRKHWQEGLKNRLAFGWLNAGFAVRAGLASLYRRSFTPWQALVEGVRLGLRR